MSFILFSREKLYVRVHANAMEVTDLLKNRTIYRESNRKFSIDRMLIADFHAAEEHLKTVAEEVTDSGSRWLKPAYDFLVQYAVDLGDGMCEVEKRALRDSAEHAGAQNVFIVPYTDKLSNEQALQKLLLALKGEKFMPPDLIGPVIK
ncbi:rod shape-determining protein [Hymenobacter actinosclerus]|uniref:Uncharacterized protein n=1 Tax=Hymenobacter actinosclerus TaxID=82805 RepID=A0A1I0I4L9_9BACT|nr:rod shape-determining protein [Hymenobacter actinosclerus]SET91452.1 hypothetical protein SAMN04487998_3134 [Hymenobacter actinosclerus]